MTSERELRAVFKDQGKERGFPFTDAEYRPFKELKSTWWRNGTSIRFKVSDYLENADRGIVEDYSRALMGRVTAGAKVCYSDRMREWLASGDFIRRSRPLYLRRSRNLALDHRGGTYDLMDLHDSLVDRGLVGDGDIYLTWTKGGNRKRVGYCSTLMRVVTVSSALDRPDVPEFVAEYVLYHELLHLEGDALSPRHGRDFRRREREHPRWREAEDWLRRLASGRV
ncbi:MAG: hypothetical protein ACLFUV_03925 [Methanomassiliicoccales archaeon]